MSSNSRRVRSIELRAHEGLEAIGADLDLAGGDGPARRARLGAAAPAHDGLDAGDELLGVARLGQPVVGPEAQAAHALGHRRLARADDHAQPRQRRAELLEVLPRRRAEHREVDDDGVQAHGHDGVDGNRAGEHAMLPGQTLQALGQHLQEARVGVDDGEPERRGVGGRGPFRHCVGQSSGMKGR